MKKSIFILAGLLFSFSVLGQVKTNTNDLIGYWRPSEESTQLFFWKDSTGKLQMQDISGSDGEPLDLVSMKVSKDSIFAKTVFTQNNWVVESTITLVDKTTLKRVVSGKIPGIIIYKKIK